MENLVDIALALFHLRNMMNEIDSRLQTARNLMNSLQQRIENHHQLVNNPNPNVNPMAANEVDIEAIWNAAVERQRRESNVIFFNIPEMRCEETGEVGNPTAEREMILSLLSRMKKVNLDHVAYIRRLGIYVNSPRPLMITMRSARDALAVLRQRKVLPANIGISADYPQVERQRIKVMKREIARHNAENPGNQKCLRIINNEPKMMDKPEPRRRKRRNRHSKKTRNREQAENNL